ncbi:hypothetical protein [Lederbergia citri]|uniref:Uncharacterized protein n=1 Tax=Lederbergia citri TaxID=2833580 RepID=A0A942YFE4_9BACI|nr:hypothetical protein [Lederbergia citri]MBS4194943.1 hypothetical protein [Lederbergia citri]
MEAYNGFSAKFVEKVNGETRPLGSIEEFYRKIIAMIDKQEVDFIVIARVGAFIAGWGY